MNYITSLTDMVLCRMPQDARSDITDQVLASMPTSHLAQMAMRDATPPDVLRALSQWPRARVRQAVALNLSCPHDLLHTLSQDTAKTVADTARRHLLWVQVSQPGARIPTHSAEHLEQLEHFFVKDHPWQTLPHSDTVLARLMQDDTWANDPRFIRLFYDSAGALPADEVRKIGGSRIAKALLQTLKEPAPKTTLLRDYEEALEWLSELLGPRETLSALKDNEDLLEPLVTRQLGAEWKTKSLDAHQGHPPEGWARVALTSCPDHVLLEALDSGNELLVELAVGQVRSRAHLLPELVTRIREEWDEEGYLRWELAAALDDDTLLELPMEVLSEHRVYGEAAGETERARKVFAHRVAEIVREQPEAWEVLTALGENYEGTARDLLAALQTL